MSKSADKKNKPVIAYTCGGTGGHIYPAIALAQELSETYQAVFIGSKDREDVAIVPRYGYHHTSVASSNRNPFILIKSFFQSRHHLKVHQAKALVSTGGYLTFSVVLAAKSLGLPIFILEQNTIMGRVNRSLLGLATRCFLSFEKTVPKLSNSNVLTLGNPVRKTYPKDPTVDAILKNLSSSKVLLVFGGSQGASALNTTVVDASQGLIDTGWEIVQITGRHDFETVSKKAATSAKWHVLAYAEDMKALYSKASAVFARAGATTIAELLAYQKPGLLVPYPFAKDNHQLVNAQVFQEMGGGAYVEQSLLNKSILLEQLDHLPRTTPKQSHNPREAISETIKDLLA